MNISIKKGFTLIELLVVIAIIALLSSVVVGQLTQQRNKSKDAAIKRELTSFRNAAELIKDNTGTYNSLCLENSESGKIYKSILNKTITNPASNNICLGGDTVKFSNDPSVPKDSRTTANPNKWGISIKMNSSNMWMCMDYRGVVMEINTRRIDDYNGGAIYYECN